jgi:hypothetical protein
MNIPDYMVKAAHDPDGNYHMFVVKGNHPPKWIFDTSMQHKGAGMVGTKLIQENQDFYRWNVIRRIVISHGVISDEQYQMLVEEVEKYNGEETDWFLACKRFVEESSK